MLEGCITGNGGRLTAYSIKRFKLFESAFDDAEEFSAGMDRLWKEKHGHDLTPRKPKAPKRVKTDADHKYCNGCERVLPVASFSADRSTPRGLAKRCRECAAKNWKQANHHICKSCESWCVGQTCRRCMLVQKQILNFETAIRYSVSGLIYESENQRRIEIKCLKQGKKTLQQIRQILNW